MVLLPWCISLWLNWGKQRERDRFTASFLSLNFRKPCACQIPVRREIIGVFPSPTEDHPLHCDRFADECVDCASAPRSVPIRHSSTLSSSRQRLHLPRCILGAG